MSSYNLKGWSFWTWLKLEKDNLKILASLLCGLLALKYGNSTLMQALFGAGSGVISKIILDTIDYFLAE